MGKPAAFVRAFKATLSTLQGAECPQCAAYALRQALGRPETDYQEGQREAALRILAKPHACGADRPPRSSGGKGRRTLISLQL